MSKPLSDTLTTVPTTESIWEYYSTSSKLQGKLSPLHFQGWTPSPPTAAPPTSGQLATALLSQLSEKYPWSQLMRGTSPGHPLCGSTLPTTGTHNTSSPLPSTSESTVDSVTLLQLLCGVSLHYTHSGTTSLGTTLHPHSCALKYSVSRAKLPEYDLTVPTPPHHTGWLAHSVSQTSWVKE